MVLEAILDHVLLDHLAVLLLCLLLRHPLELLPGCKLVLTHKVEEAWFGNIDISHCGLLEVAVDL